MMGCEWGCSDRLFLLEVAFFLGGKSVFEEKTWVGVFLIIIGVVLVRLKKWHFSMGIPLILPIQMFRNNYYLFLWSGTATLHDKSMHIF